MNVVKRLFGVDANQIKQDVIITPFLNLSYFARSASSQKTKGFLFEVLTQKQFSVVKTGVGASFVGDAIMYLRDTPCKRVYFIGSGASSAAYDIGDTLVIEKALACESFTEVLHIHTHDCSFVIPENNLSNRLLEFSNSNCNKIQKGQRIKATNVASLGSLSLQNTVLESLQQRGIGCVDMEVSAFFSAANSVSLPCLALLYITDTIAKKLYFRNLSDVERRIIKEARQRTIALVCDFIKQQGA